MTTDADRLARDRLAREARETATTLLDWVGTRVEGARTEPGDRPRQSPGPCTWCPVCALVAVLRGEQSELSSTLAEQVSGLLVLLRLLVQAHATGSHDQHDHHAAPPAAATGPREDPAPTTGPTTGPPGRPAEWGVPTWQTDVPWDVAPHATFDPAPTTRVTPEDPADDDPRPAPERPTGRRGPRPSPRRAPGAPAAEADGPAVGTAPAPEPAVAAAPVAPGPVVRNGAAPRRGVQRIPVRRRPRPC